MREQNTIRNVAIIAHVDHGKTTLVNELLQQGGVFRDNEQIVERCMDHNDLERERGITILAKCTSFFFRDIKYNIVDTPGHADFSGEVERILSMVDGAILLVDAAEGPMPQTKFVLGKALQAGLKLVVVVNKVDRPDSRIDEVVEEIYELFMSLDATDEQLDFPLLYAVGRNGWASNDKNVPGTDLTPLFEAVVKHVPAPLVDIDAPFSMLATMQDSDPYVGRILIGRVASGKAAIGSNIKCLDLDGEVLEQGKLTKIFNFRGIQRVPAQTIEAGDIVAVAGLQKASVSNTICDPVVEMPLRSTPIDPATISVMVSVNNSPFAGKEGTKVTSRMILERLEKEVQGNITIGLSVDDAAKERFEVKGRGELQLGVLLETMRREGFELSVSRPRVVMLKDEQGQTLEPIEEAVLDLDEEYMGIVMEKLALRRGDLVETRYSSAGKLRMIYHIPTRGLVGYRSIFLNDTRGTGIMNRVFLSYQPYRGDMAGRKNGVLIANAAGEATAYSLASVEERGALFIAPGTKVYQGMIIGEHSRDNDLEVNVIRAKQLTNIRAAGKDEAIRLTPPRQMTLEEALSYIQGGELIEITPATIRLRKLYLDPNDRKKAERTGEV